MSRSPLTRRLPACRTLSILLTLLTALAGPASLAPVVAAAPARLQQTQAAPASSKLGYNDNVLVIYRDEAGEMSCRAATPEEKQAVSAARRNPAGEDAAETSIIYTGGGGRGFVDENGEVVASPSVTETGTALQPSVGLRIVLHSTQQLQNNPTARDAFIVAANRWEALISTPITVVLDVDYGTTFFGTPFSSSNVIGATSTRSQSASLSSVRTQLLSNAPEPEEAQVYNALPASSVPVELNGSTTSASSVRMTRPVARALGLTPDIANPDALPIGQGDAGIAFNSAFSFDFTPNNGITPGQLDFDAVVVHEIGHALGFTSESGDGFASPLGMWDLFRFRPGAANLSTVPTATRVMSEGGSQVFFNNRSNSFGTTELALSTGGSDGNGGDGEQSSHWKDDRFTPFIGIMDPTLSPGRREVITDNDLKAIDTFGYKIGGTAPPPPPPPAAPANDNFANAVVLSGATGAVNGTNVGATAQAGEPDPSSGTGPGPRSVWYRWTAIASGSTTFDTVGSDYDTTLGAYTGGGFPLAVIAQNDDIVLGQNIQSRITFNAVAGQTYNIMVNGFDGDTGNIQLNWTAPGGQTSFRISGRVTDNFAATVDAATVRLFNLSGELLAQTATDSLGNYAFTGVAAGEYGVVASKAGYSDAGATVNGLNADRTVNLVLSVAPFTVSGFFRDAQNNAITGAGYTVSTVANTIFGANPVNGAYSVSISPTAAAPVTITPVKYGYTFAPSSVSFNTTSVGNQTVNFVGTLNNPIDASALFVTQQYRDFLGREPDQAGLDFWRSGIEACGPIVPCTEVRRIDTSAAFFLAIEFQETGVLVYRTHKAAFGDLAGTPIPVRRATFVADQALIAQNVQVGIGNWQEQLEANKVAYFNAFVGGAAFTAAFPLTMTPAQFVDKLNQNAEGALSQAERDTLVGELTTGARSRAQVLRAVAEDATFAQSQFRRAFVYMQYVGYLRRDPDAPDFRGVPDPQFLGFNFWLGKLNEFDGSYIDAEMVKAFITSIEYRQRFGQ